MRESPRRPLILKRRKLPFQRSGHDEETDGPQSKTASTASAQSFPHGICIMDHPTKPDTQVVVIPKTADLQSLIGALTAKGKECGPQGPNKFILLSGSSSLEDGVCPFFSASSETQSRATSSRPEGCAKEDLLENRKPLKKEANCSLLENSLTSIQWLGEMSTDVLGSEPAKTSSENLQQPVQAKEEMDAVKIPLSERPPYSYMAMIQFAINSKKSRKMTLKEIYNWIESHFPYYRNVAKPGWKNSIRHNLSLHDMFVRESTPDGKISFWTIRPEANRCLTLDQVFKPVDLPALGYTQTAQVCNQQQQKRAMAEQKKVILPSSTERKMKPLLPRTDSYLVPIQLPLTPSLILPSSAPFPVSTTQNSYMSSTPSDTGGGKRIRIAPKVPLGGSSSVKACNPGPTEIKEEPVCVPVSSEPPKAPPDSGRRRESSSSRRKQSMVLPSNEEHVLLLPNSTFFDSGVVSDNSTCQDTRDTEPELQKLQHDLQPESPSQGYTFKTPIKSSHLASSTPSKPQTSLEPWRITPLGKSSNSMLDFSPIRTPNGPLLTPHRHEHMTFSLNSTPFKELPLFSSPRELLTCSRSSPLRNMPSCSRQLQVGAANCSLTEGLVLDTMNDSLSKILVDISFSGLEDDDLGMANISWSQFIPELK
ncbi:forkhead box protein M1 isoform X1 [Astyanax mexicanus]|uniref:forkhead box protein M1 isoform X1 n=1 Tax=Astyanax mexicanus TaxID=7994 RepID=UPI0020CABB36|nr:forkhead box protein M1 isoform X1 [Astyanax mexicanus]XP_049331062.1 forkhead box protein M1 isoform X1 [Astyanax mexicanus]